MENEPGTEAIEATPDAINAQTETGQEEPAVNETTETQTDQSTEDVGTTDDGMDDDDLSWAERKGVNLEDKAAVAKMLRNADRKVSEVDVKAKNSLKDAVSDVYAGNAIEDDVLTEMQLRQHMLETKLATTSYFLDNAEDRKYENEAATILNEESQRDVEFARALTRNLPQLFALARARHAEEAVANAKQEGRKEERRSLAAKQRASATSQAATSSAPPVEKDPFLEGFNNPW